MFVDAHQHFWSISRGDYGWLNAGSGPLWRDFRATDLAPIIARHNIAGTVLVQAAPSIEETEYMLGIADAVDWVRAVVGWVDFGDSQHRQHLQRWSRHPKFRGVRPMLQDIPDPEWILRAEHAWAFDALLDCDLHFEFLGKSPHLDAALKLTHRYPRLRLVLDHAMKPNIRRHEFEPWAAGMTRLATETQALCKISGLVTEAASGWTLADLKPYVDHAVAAFGAERVMWGSDWPVVNLNGSYDNWRAVTLALLGAHPGVQSILGGTAARFYRFQAVKQGARST